MRSKKDLFDDFVLLFGGLGPKVSQGGPRDLPRVPQGQKSSKMGLKMTPKSSTNVVRRLSENASQGHTH